jgi:hypothetical protein
MVHTLGLVAMGFAVGAASTFALTVMVGAAGGANRT